MTMPCRFAQSITPLLAALMLGLTTLGCGHVRGAWQKESPEAGGEREFAELMVRKGFRYATAPELTQPVMRVAGRILDAARASAYATRAQEVRWDVILIDAPGIGSAFATPGGRIVVFTGLFPVAATEAGLAAVLGHEVAHVLEEHGAKASDVRARQEFNAAFVGTLAGVAAAVATNNNDAAKVGQAVATSLQRAGTITIVLPYNRQQEIEADRLGVELAARAGYDPREALLVLERSSPRGAREADTTLSTHPSVAARLDAMRFWASDALILYRGKNAPGALDPLPAPEAAVKARTN